MQPEHYGELLGDLRQRLKLALAECHEHLDIGDVRDMFEETLANEYDGDYRRPR